ncbi:ABC transporter ATP-binding protein [Nonomuraea sp. NPDC050790]|uniref:ABC transporter ATP-binding protein n=1 Tax=Nonomuraea sp. NPDC050790 TaxID=3364371 RepID=UPI00379F84B9
MTGTPLIRPGDGAGRLLVRLLAPRARPLVVAALWSAVEAAPNLLSGLLIANAVDRGFLPGDAGTGFAWLAVLGAAMLLQAAATRLMFPALAAVAEPLRDDLVTAVVTATVNRAVALAEPPDTAAITRLTEQVEMVRNLVSALLRSARALGISLVAAFTGLVLLSPSLAAAVAVPVALSLIVFVLLLRILVTRQRALILTGERLTSESTPILAGLRDVAACGAQREARVTVRAAIDAQAAAGVALAWAGTTRRLIVTLGAHVPLLVLILAARPLIEGGHLSAGEVVGAVAYLATGLDPALRSLVGTVSGWAVPLAVTLRRIAETLAPPAVTPPPTPPRVAAVPAGHRIRLERVTFAYAPGAAPVVRDLDLEVEEGEHLALVGPSGIGKSTLSMLLTGLRVPTRGQVLLGGVPIGAVPPTTLRSAVALVPQEAYVFSGTVAENLAYLCPGDAEAARERIGEAVSAVGAERLVSRLGGLSALIEQPSWLSAGERQLLALARAHASPARVVVLDEATCHLDPAAEHRAETAFAARPGTLIVIAHRMSSAVRAQRVVLMDGSQVLAGSHRELVSRSPLYANLVGHWTGGDPSMPAATPYRPLPR